MADAPELRLEAAPAPRTERVKKDRDYKDYVPIYKREVRTIKWWVEQGRKKNDLPPLDDPIQMPQWWDRVMSQRCPQGVLDAAHAAAAAPAVSAVPVVPPSSQGQPHAPLTPKNFENPTITTREQNLQHLKEQLDRARRDQLEAQHADNPDPAVIEAKSRKWRELNAEVMKAEEAVFKLRSKQGKLVDMDTLGGELQPLLTTVASAVRGLWAKLRPALMKAPSEDEADLIWQNGVDDCFGELISSGFVRREQLALSA